MKNSAPPILFSALLDIFAPVILVIFTSVLEQTLYRDQYITFFLAIKTVLIMWAGWSACCFGVKKFQHGFYPALYFILFSTLYFVIFPLIAVVIGAHFIINDHEIFGYQRLFDMALLSIVVFYITYISVVSNVTNISIKNSIFIANPHIIKYCFAILFIGLASAAWLTNSVSVLDVQTYEDVTPAFTGKGWVLRLSELLAVSGILFIASHQRLKGKFFIIGCICLLAFVTFRAQFLNRENIVKYVFIVVIYYTYINPVPLSKKWMSILAIGIFTILIFMPYISILRAQISKKFTQVEYSYAFTRDLNFAEVAAVLYANDEFRGAAGLREGLYRTYSQLSLRDYNRAKPFPIGTTITARTTKLPFYDEFSPTFAYAPTFLGAFYYIRGSWLAMCYVAIMAFMSAALSNWTSKEKSPARSQIKKAFLAIFIYHFIISAIKLDPGNALPNALVPCFFSFIAAMIYGKTTANGAVR